MSGASGEFPGTGIPARKRAISLGPAFDGATGIARGATWGLSCAETLNAVASTIAVNNSMLLFNLFPRTGSLISVLEGGSRVRVPVR